MLQTFLVRTRPGSELNTGWKLYGYDVAGQEYPRDDQLELYNAVLISRSGMYDIEILLFLLLLVSDLKNIPHLLWPWHLCTRVEQSCFDL